MKLPTREQLERRLRDARREGIKKLQERIAQEVNDQYVLLVESGEISIDVSYTDRKVVEWVIELLPTSNPDYLLRRAEDPSILIIELRKDTE